MSHIVEHAALVEDLDILAQAAARFGLTVQQNVAPRYWGTHYGRNDETKICDLVIALPGKYDLGVKRYSDGHYGWVCDSELLSGSFGMSDPGRKLLGDNAENLMTAYEEVKLEAELMQAGVNFTRTVDPDGTVRYEVEDSQLPQLGVYISS